MTAAIDPRALPYLRRIHAVYPDLSITTASVDGRGQNNDIVRVDGRLIFRFPRYDGAVSRLQAEVALLAVVRRHVSLSVPVPLYTSFQTGAGNAFAGYAIVPGQPLQRETIAAIEAEAEPLAARLADQIKLFLRQLHAVPLDPALARTVPPDRGRAGLLNLYSRIRATLFPLMRPDARREVADHFARFFAVGERTAAYVPTLVHHDFGPGNILYDAERCAISGVIDFGEAGLGDPAYDLAGLLAGYGERFVRRVLHDDPGASAVLARARFYAGTFALEEALFGVEHGDPRALERGLAAYR